MLNPLKKIWNTFTSKFHTSDKPFYYRKEKPPVFFDSISIKEKTPPNSEINDKEFVLVKFKRKNTWTLFKCPCGCNHVISLSLQKSHSKHWSAKKARSGRPSLYPSVWQIKGCRSHFWIDDGRVYWCGNDRDYF